jgi:serine/threonine protein kinase
VAGRYRLCSPLGRGGMGLVWLARDEVLHRSVALKQVLPHGLDPGDRQTAGLARARWEAQAAARIDHAGVIRIHDMVEDDGLVWVAMEVLSGRTLREALLADGPLPVGAVTRVGLWLLDALHATHQQEIVHRDVKPANVFLCQDGRVVLLDFGIASALDDEATVAGGDFVGSPAYVAPELIRGGQVRPESDLFSLGATLFAAVEGDQPFPGGSIFDTLAGVLEDAPGPFVHAGPLRPVIEGLLAKEPEQRTSAQAATAALESIDSRFGAARWPIESQGRRAHQAQRWSVPA